jgi:isocitrate dehydrogenase (NAD+)
MSARHEVVLVVGGGIGPEIVPPVLDVVAAAGVHVAWERHDVPEKGGEAFPEELLDPAVAAVRRVGLALKTRLVAPVKGRFRSPNVLLRRKLGLYATVRPVHTLPGLPTRYPGLDLVIVRENTEDLYAGIEHEIVPGVVQSLKVVTERACERIARFAFASARKHGRRQVTFVHKANIMKMADGLFLRVVRRVAAENADVAYGDMIVDNACMQLVMDPLRFDVMLMGNLYGDILSDLVAGLAGGIAASAGVNIGDDCRVYEAIHGDAPGLVGTGRADPLPLLLPAVHLLRHIGEAAAADRILTAVGVVLSDPRAARTPDLGGDATAAAMAGAIIAALPRA